MNCACEIEDGKVKALCEVHNIIVSKILKAVNAYVNLRVDSEAQEVLSKVSLTVKDEHIPAVKYALDMLTKRLERLK